MAKRNSSLVEKEKQRQDTGFGTKATSTQARLMKPNGNFNVIKTGQPFEAKLNLYHRLITMHWVKFALLIFVFYFTLNLLFAGLYLLLGIENLQGSENSTQLSDFWLAFFFSSQTLTTVGYGHISPMGFGTSMLASIQALIGLMIFAIMTGLLYGRFSRPNPAIKFSHKILISPYLDINGLMLRLVNEKSNQLINVKASIIFSRNEESNGEIIRKYYTLELERENVQYFPMSWTIVHPITKKSPIYKETEESLKASDAEFLVSIEGLNDTFADPIHAKKSYMYFDLIFGAKFQNILSSEGANYRLHINDIDKCEPAILNEYDI